MDKKFRTKKQIADLLGINSNTFSSYCTGHRQISIPATRKKLFDLTGIESFLSEKPNSQEGNLLREWVESVVLRKDDVDKKKIEGLAEDVKVSDSLNRAFPDMASELRNWFNNQDRWATYKEFAEYLGVPYSTMKKIFQGIREPKDIFRQKLYEVTQLASFKDIEQEEKKKLINEIETKSVPCQTDNSKIENKIKTDCCVHIKLSTHERLMRRKKDGSQSFDNVIVELLDENIELKRKLKRRVEKDETTTITNPTQAE